jgi:hypothetical protein
MEGRTLTCPAFVVAVIRPAGADVPPVVGRAAIVPDHPAHALPGVSFGGFAAGAGPDLVQPRQDRGAKLNRQRPHAAL